MRRRSSFSRFGRPSTASLIGKQTVSDASNWGDAVVRTYEVINRNRHMLGREISNTDTPERTVQMNLEAIANPRNSWACPYPADLKNSRSRGPPNDVFSAALPTERLNVSGRLTAVNSRCTWADANLPAVPSRTVSRVRLSSDNDSAGHKSKKVAAPAFRRNGAPLAMVEIRLHCRASVTEMNIVLRSVSTPRPLV